MSFSYCFLFFLNHNYISFAWPLLDILLLANLLLGISSITNQLSVRLTKMKFNLDMLQKNKSAHFSTLKKKKIFQRVAIKIKSIKPKDIEDFPMPEWCWTWVEKLEEGYAGTTNCSKVETLLRHVQQAQMVVGKGAMVDHSLPRQKEIPPFPRGQLSHTHSQILVIHQKEGEERIEGRQKQFYKRILTNQ